MESVNDTNPPVTDLLDAGLTTPALLIDLPKLDARLAWGKARAEALGVLLRPHLKTHKCVAVARRQMRSPEGPACVSTLAEARAFWRAGVKDLLYAVGVSPQKLPEVVRLCREGCRLTVLVDSPEAAACVAKASLEATLTIRAMIEIDCDGHRSGLSPESEALLAVARALVPDAALAGVLTHAGESYSAPDFAAQRAASHVERDAVVRAAERLRAVGFECPVVSVGSTPTFFAADDWTGVTEVRAGVYATGDLFMANNGVLAIEEIALSVLATVIGHRDDGALVLDAGWSALSRDRSTASQARDFAYGLVCDATGRPLAGGTVLVTALNQEHGLVRSVAGRALSKADYPIGTRLRILPNHACATAACHGVVHFVDAAGRLAGREPRITGW